MACSDDLANLGWERLGSVGGREPCRSDGVLVEESEESVDAYCCAEDTARYVGGVCGDTGLGVEPAWGVSRLRGLSYSGVWYQPLTASMSTP